MIDGWIWLGHLSSDDCRELLGFHTRGPQRRPRQWGPQIYPVNHVLDGQTIVIRTDPGSRLRGLLRCGLPAEYGAEPVTAICGRIART